MVQIQQGATSVSPLRLAISPSVSAQPFLQGYYRHPSLSCGVDCPMALTWLSYRLPSLLTSTACTPPFCRHPAPPSDNNVTPRCLHGWRALHGCNGLWGPMDECHRVNFPASGPFIVRRQPHTVSLGRGLQKTWQLRRATYTNLGRLNSEPIRPRTCNTR
jgi:hypothetical protein